MARLNARSRSLRILRGEASTQLPRIAKEAWEWAERICEPTRVVSRPGGTVRVLGCEDDILNVGTMREAKQVIRLLVAGRRPNGSKADQTRNWAIWRMMTVLREWSVIPPKRKRALFPFPTANAAASGVVEGFRAAGLDSTLTPDRVRKNYERHFRNR